MTAASLLFAITGTSAAQERSSAQRGEAPIHRGALDTGPESGQHGPQFGHLPPVQKELELVGELEPTASQGPIVEGQIADLAVHEGYAYLNSWDEPSCTKGGTYIADIRDPANPQEIGFLPAADGYYHGEGAHAVSLTTPAFSGDLLALNDEACSNDATRPANVPGTAGGFDLYDVSDPTNPVLLVENFGDTTEDGSLTPDPDPARLPNSYHSVFVWQDGPRAYLVGVDNDEFADVDIYDITDPRAPVFINDFDLFNLDADGSGTTYFQIVSESALNDDVFTHDMVVKQIDGRMVMMVAYWDGGYVQLDVSDPLNPTYITDTNFDEPDPLTGFDPPEGNAHQGEFSHDNEFLLAADEDFAPDRIDRVEITTGPNAGEFPASVIGGSAPSSILEDGALNGPTYYGGYGCPNSAPVPDRATINPTLAPGEEAILVLQRGPVGDPAAPEGACFPGEKAQTAIDAGWDAVLLTNRHGGGGDANCGSGGFSSPIVAVCTTHEALHVLFNHLPGAGEPVPYPPGHNPPIGAAGEKISATPQFDGWGFAHLYDAKTSEELDAFAIPEALDERFASGFGDLSIHEFATDPDENLAYSSYYSGGIRVFMFGRNIGLQQTGAWVDPRGSNFWGVEQFTSSSGERLIAGSDRDFGLQILRYTGPHPPGGSAPPGGPGAAGGPGADQDPPETTITRKPKQKTASDRVRFRFSSDEPDSTFECKLDRKPFLDCKTPYKKEVDSGKHRFKVRAIDAAGNVDATADRDRWKVKR